MKELMLYMEYKGGAELAPVDRSKLDAVLSDLKADETVVGYKLIEGEMIDSWARE